MVANDQDNHHHKESMRENLEQYFEDSDAEESLSFCDLPIYDKSEASTTTTTNRNGTDDDDDDDDRRRMSTDQQLFEFFSDLKADMCPADDVIFCGKLISYKEKDCHRKDDKNQILDVFDDDDDGNPTCRIKSFFRRRRRTESLNSLQRSQSSDTKDRLPRTNYQKLRRISSSKKTLVEPVDRYKSGKCSRKGNSSSLPTSSAPARPRWPLLMFGMVNAPKEMELKDIRNRQNRRNPTLLFPEFIAGGGTEKVRVRREEEKGSWRLLRALSCRGHGSTAVAAS
ncbi:uncharacterized protein LOC122072272 [Macadamia integrifolia]|uniref:uncharacterized protein LOC122072272 n=1 Tax=Macadamia integrifolia TaxID=60698 RepID=UPI001C4F26EB|nr:uncharacterized protein LOC122072272 [Macadamia integrifolia]